MSRTSAALTNTHAVSPALIRMDPPPSRPGPSSSGRSPVREHTETTACGNGDDTKESGEEGVARSAPASGAQHLRLGQAPRHLQRGELVVTEVAEAVHDQPVGVVGPGPLGELVALDRRDAGGGEHRS